MFNLMWGRRSLSYFRTFLEFSPSTGSHYFCLRAANTLSNYSNEQSITVSYLINSCGLSPEKALSVSKHVRVKSAEKCDSVLAIFKKYGFTETQISASIATWPQILSCKPDKTILPKLEFFSSIGLSSTEIARFISGSATLLNRSLEKNIIPTYMFFCDLFQSNEKAIFAFKRYPMLFSHRQVYATNNLQILREAGVPESNAMAFLQRQPRSFMTDADTFKKIVEEVKEMGFDPLRMNFMVAVYMFRAMSKSTFRKKVKELEKWGLSKDEVLVAVRKEPKCMFSSQDKIARVMHFLVNRLGLKPYVIVDMPVLLGLSLEKRLYPRVLVYEVLLEKGLIKNASLLQLFKYSEHDFLNKILKKYDDKAPNMLKLYMEQNDISCV